MNIKKKKRKKKKHSTCLHVCGYWKDTLAYLDSDDSHSFFQFTSLLCLCGFNKDETLAHGSRDVEFFTGLGVDIQTTRLINDT